MHLETHLPLLLDLLLKSAVLLAFAALLTAAFRRASAANRHALAFAALVTLLVLPFTKLSRPRWSFALNHDAPATPLTIKLPPITTVASSETAPGSALVAPVNAPAKAAGIRVNWSALGVGVWLAGSALVLMHRVGVGLQLRRLAGESRAINEGRVLAMARELAAACGVRAEIRESDTCRVPLAFGVWRPTVLLPGEAMGWSDGRLSAALQHEFGHIRRRDCLTRWFADLACAFYWVNPLVWLGARSLRLAQEQACDDLVLNSGAPAGQYAEQLVEVVRSLQGDRFTARHALAMAQPSTLETRVRAIVDESRDRSARSVRGAFAGFAFAAAALALCSAAQLRGADGKKAAALADAGPSRAVQVEIAARFIEITDGEHALAEFLEAADLKAIPTLTGIVPTEKADAVLKKLAKEKGVDVLSAPRVTTKPNQRAVIEIIREFPYPTGWEKEAKREVWKPKTFETKDIGVTFEVTPEVLEHGAISLKMTPQIVEFEGFVDLDGEDSKIVGRPDASKPARERLTALPIANAIPAGHRAQPVFKTRKMTTEATVRPGQTIVIGGFEGPDAGGNAKAGLKEPKKRLVVLVTTRGFTLDEVNAWQKEAEAKGKIEVQSDAINVDKKTGAISASGNVKIDTAQATITAASAEIMPKNAEARKRMEEAATEIIFPVVGFHHATLREVVEFMVAKSKERDPEKKGINIVIQDGVKQADPRITVGFRDIPFIELLKYVTNLTDTRWRSTPFGYVIEPLLAEVPSGNAHGAAMKKAAGIIFPKIDFRDATLREVVEFLVTKSKALDPAGKGENIVIKDRDKLDDARITLSLTNIPLTEVLRYVADLANCEVVKEELAFVLQPAETATTKPAPASKNEARAEEATLNKTQVEVQATGRPIAASKPLEELVTKQWKVQPEIFKGGPAHQILMQRGIVFGQGAFAMFSPDSNVLLVRNTPAQLALVEQILGPAVAAPAVPPLPKDAPGAVGKANAIIIPNVDFRNVTVSEAVDFLQAKSKELDPEKKGVKIILEPAVGGAAPNITLRLKNVPLIEAIKYVTALASYEIVAEDKAIILQPAGK